MERGTKIVSSKRVDDTEDRKIIERVIEEHDFEPMDAIKLRKFMDEKRHKIRRFPKKPTKIVEKEINKVNKSEQINKSEQTTSSKTTLNKTEFNMNFRFKSDDESEEEIKPKKSIKKPTKVKAESEEEIKAESEKKVKAKSEEKVKAESEEEIKSIKSIKKPTKINKTKSDSDDESDEEIKSKTSLKPSIKKPTKVKAESDEDNKPKNPEKVNDKSEEESLSKIQLLNQELFKENSNKSRNEDIKAAWKSLSEYELPDKDNLIIKKSHPGHFVTQGWCAGSLRNPHWLIMNKNGDEYYIMNCGNDVYTKFSVEDYNDVINPDKYIYPTWTKCKNGYIDTHSYITTGNRIYLHQVICKKHNEKKYATI